MKDEADKSRPTDQATPEPPARANPDTDQLAAGVSALLAELVSAPEAELAAWTPGLQAGDRLGRFTLRRELGRGGMGVVWEADDPDLARVVALKVVRPGTRAAARGPDWVRREAEAVARLNHPNIVTLYDFGLAASGPFLVFELLRGQPLDARLRAGPLPFPSVLSIGTRIARALVHAHTAGVVHRDLKPANVFVSDDGEVKVLDFGLAGLLGRSGAGQGGTPAFMAPEQWRGELGDERADLFALGVTLWHALTGDLPYPVVDGHSAVERPGPTPRLPPASAPAALRRLIERCLERDPKDRPATARAVLEELRALRRHLDGRWRRRILAALGGVAALATVVAGWLWWRQEPPPGEVLKTVVADVDNQSGDPALDGVSGLLATALESSKRVALVPRARLLAMAREAKVGDLQRLEPEAARELARLASAQVLLLPAARRAGAGLTVELRAQEPATGRTLFSLSEPAADALGVPAALDRLGAATRRELKERRDDLRAASLTVGSAVSPSLAAARAYFAGMDCVAQPSRQAVRTHFACPHFFEEALAHDPAFALAHLQLAILLYAQGATSFEARPHIEAAQRALDRLPARERTLVRAWAAHVDGRDEESLRALDDGLAAYPDDRQALDLAGTIRFGRHDFLGAIPYFQRIQELDPGEESSASSLVNALAMLDRREELRRHVDRLVALPHRLGLVRAISHGQFWLGEGEAAVATCRRAVELDGPGMAPQYLADVLDALGRFAEAEPLHRAELAAAPADGPAHWRLAFVLSAQGRLREALRLLDLAEQRAGGLRAADHAFMRSIFLAGGADREALWRAAAKVQALDPENAGPLAELLAVRGDMPHAAQLASDLRKGSPLAEQYQALVMARGGLTAEAIARLAALEASERLPVGRIAPAYLLAEVGALAGDARETLAAVERYRRLWLSGYWRNWAWPRSFLLAARAHQALGDAAAARQELDRLLALLAHADPDLPLLLEARALRRRM